MGSNGSERTKPGAAKLTAAQVAKMLKGRGLKASPEEAEQLARMMNDDLAREAAKAAALTKQSEAVDRFMAQFHPKKKRSS
jgi:hypothetical protein